MRFGEKTYRVELPNENIGRARYAEIPRVGKDRVARTPQKAVSDYVMEYCEDNKMEGRVILTILKKKYGGLETFAKEIPAEVQPRTIKRAPVRISPDGKEYRVKQLRLF